MSEGTHARRVYLFVFARDPKTGHSHQLVILPRDLSDSAVLVEVGQCQMESLFPQLERSVDVDQPIHKNRPHLSSHLRHHLLSLPSHQTQHMPQNLPLVLLRGLPRAFCFGRGGERARPFLIWSGLIADGGSFGPALFEIGDVPAEDSLGGEVAHPAIHRFSNMKIILTEPLTAHTLYIPFT